MNYEIKAKELLEKFTCKCKECDYEYNAKQFAIQAVNEIIEFNSNQLSHLSYNEQMNELDQLIKVLKSI